jgi:transcription initiation factor TFIID subunit 11
LKRKASPPELTKEEIKRLCFQDEIRNLELPDKKKEELIEYDERTRMLRIVNAFTEEQVDRYEIFRRSCFPRNQIKRLMQQVSGTIVNQQVCIAMAGVAKVFVGELVEEALKVAEQRKDEGALLPSHIREAVRRLGEVEGSNCYDSKRKRKRLF